MQIEHSAFLAKMQWAQNFILIGSLTRANPGLVWRVLSLLFSRDGRAMEFFSGIGILFWAVLCDLATDRSLVPQSLSSIEGLVSPDLMIFYGYVLGVTQIAALISLRRWVRAPVAVLATIFLGVLTQSVWSSASMPPGGSAMYCMAWGMNGYIFIRLCRPLA